MAEMPVAVGFSARPWAAASVCQAVPSMTGRTGKFTAIEIELPAAFH